MVFGAIWRYSLRGTLVKGVPTPSTLCPPRYRAFDKISDAKAIPRHHHDDWGWYISAPFTLNKRGVSVK